MIYYGSDNELHARACLLCDQNATDFLEFLFIAVRVTISVRELEAYHF